MNTKTMDEKLIIGFPGIYDSPNSKFALALGDHLDQFFAKNSEGAFDEYDAGDEFPDDVIVATLCSKNVEKLFKTISPILKSYELPPGTFIVKRRTGQTDERLQLNKAPARADIHTKNLELAFSALEWRHGSPWNSPENFAFTDISELVEAYCSDAVEHALSNFELQLEHSSVGMERLDQALEQLSEKLPRDSTGQLLIVDPLSAEMFSNICKAYGSYLGESMKLSWAGEWDAEAMLHDARSWRMNIANKRFLPIVKVCRRIVHGSIDSVLTYYQSIELQHCDFVETYPELDMSAPLPSDPVAQPQGHDSWLSRVLRVLKGKRQ